ncbi:interleukin-2 receptor subunit beta [Tenrec ecaudatus]|uniref:interleukin-2 receptor subunit beta n=1 Tax=Tenrec ecaudatus TaxID=94439 RepID=UPI003F5AC650
MGEAIVTIQLYPVAVMAGGGLSWHLPILTLLAILGLSEAVNDTSTLTCFYNSKANISCIWSQEDGAPQLTSCQVYAEPDKRRWRGNCSLYPWGPKSWACNLVLGLPSSQQLTAADIVSISVRCLEGKRQRLMTSLDFKPFENLRLMAPESLQVVHVETHRCNITWMLPYYSHYIERYLEFQAQARPPDHSWEEAPLLSIQQNQQWICLETLAPDTPYQLQVRARAQRGHNTTWSPWSPPLDFRTKPEAPGKTLPLSWLGHMIVALSGALAFILLVYLLVHCQYIRTWLKKVLECHIPNPSEFFSQLSTEHGGDFQKWLSSPFPSASFSPSCPAPEISQLEVLDHDAKALQLLLQPEDKAPVPKDKAPVPSPGSHSQASCFTNQGYFFFHLPDELQIEACQVYFTYDPCAEEPEEGGPSGPEGSPWPALPPLPEGEDAYCSFPPGDDLLLFSPSLLMGLGRPNSELGGGEAMEEGLPSSLQGEVSGEADSRSLGPPTAEASNGVAVQSLLQLALGGAKEEAPGPGSVEGAPSPWATPSGQGQTRALASCLALNTDAYLSLQELQGQDPAHSV